jgi:hypothetical protein
VTRAEKWIGALEVVAPFSAAVVGAIIGGKIANDGAQGILSQQIRVQREQEAAAARASARQLVAELVQLNTRVSYAATDACWWPGDYRIDLPGPDRKQLAAGLPPAIWSEVARVFNLESSVSQERIAGFEWIGGSRSADMDVASETLSVLDALIPQLSRFGGIPTPPLGDAPPRVRAYRGAREVPSDSSRNARCIDRSLR